MISPPAPSARRKNRGTAERHFLCRPQQHRRWLCAGWKHVKPHEALQARGARPETQGMRPDQGSSPPEIILLFLKAFRKLLGAHGRPACRRPQPHRLSLSFRRARSPLWAEDKAQPPPPPKCRPPHAASSRAPPRPHGPSPPLTLQQPLDDAVDVQLVYIRHRLSAAGRTPPRRSPPSAGCSAGPTPLFSSARRAFPVPSILPVLFLPSRFSPPPPLCRCSQRSPSAEQNGRLLLSELGGADGYHEREAAHGSFYRRAGSARRGEVRTASVLRILPPTGGEIVPMRGVRSVHRTPPPGPQKGRTPPRSHLLPASRVVWPLEPCPVVLVPSPLTPWCWVCTPRPGSLLQEARRCVVFQGKFTTQAVQVASLTVV